MVKSSWLVTLTPLFIAILQLAEAYLSGNGLTTEKLIVVITMVMAFLGSGTIGAKLSIANKKPQ